MKKRILVLCLLLTVLNLSACAFPEAPAEDTAIPHRMITRIDVVAFPDDYSMAHSYENTETLTAIIRMVQNMATAEIPEEEPQLDGERTYFSVTATYADGNKDSYHILDMQFLQDRNGQWCIVDSVKADELAQFIRSTPSN